jgi:lipopolysaccharide export system protein LptA
MARRAFAGRWVVRLALGALAFAGAAGRLSAQQGCQFIEGSGNLQTVDAGGGSVTYVTTPNLSCRDGVRIRADSAVAFQASNYVQLIGNVRFEDPERRLTARTAEYFSAVGRLQAHQDAVLTQKSDSSVVRGDEMIYNRADEGRPRAQLDVYGDRPTARLYLGRDSTDTAADSARAPYDIVADRILIEDGSYFRARGEVEITRDDLRAFGDSVEYDQVASTLRLIGRARMRIDERDLSAETITAELPGDQVRDVIARRNALVTAEDIRLRAPLIHVFFEEGAMERLVATPIPQSGPAPAVEPTAALPTPQPGLSEADRARPVATAEDFTMVADSLDVLAPAEVLDRINAVGGARAESTARDSLNTPETPSLARSDWMEGDTIVAQFVPRDSAAAPDSAAAMPDSARDEYRLERLSATGKARSLYRMEPNDSARARGDKHPAIHYVTAASIVLEWDDGEIRAMQVLGQTEGVHAEPAAASDSAAARGDSTLAPADTTEAGGGAAGFAAIRPRAASAGDPSASTALAPDIPLPQRRGRPRRRRR